MLEKQSVTINLSAGLDTKTDEKHVVPGKLTKLENGVYRKGMRIDKRLGYDEIPNFDIDGNALGTGSGLDVFNDELLLFNDQKLYGYAEGANKWVDKGFTVNTVVTSEQVVKNTATQENPDSAILNDVGVYAWEDSRGGVRASIVDEQSGSILLADQLLFLGGSVSRPRCFVAGQYIYVAVVQSAQILCYGVNTRLPNEFEFNIMVQSGVDANSTFEVINVGERIFLLYNNSGGNTSGKWFNYNLDSLTDGLYIDRDYTYGDMDNCCTLVFDTPNNSIFCYYHNGAGDLRKVIFDEYGREQSDASVNATFTTLENVTAIEQTPNTSIWDIYFSVPGGFTADVLKVHKITDNNDSYGPPSVIMRSVSLYTKAWSHTDNNGNRSVYLGVAHESDLQATYFVITGDGTVVGKQQYTNGGGLRDIGRNLANVTQVGDVFSYAILKKNRIVSENATIFTPTGVMRTSVDFSNVNRFVAKQLGNNLMIVGGVLNMYDGQSIVEHGFLLWPERVVTAAVGSGGSLADGVYQVYVVYEWADNYGQIHRSRPSVASSVTCSAGGSDSITVTAPTLRVTRKDGSSRAAVSVVGYVTEVNGSIAYRFTSVSTPILNDLSVDTVSLGTITSVTTSNEILYTTGDVLANDPAPACSVIEVFQNRAWLAGLEEASAVNFSKENKIGAPVEFTADFTKAIESGGGRVKALSFIDDKLIAMKSDKSYITYGDGPNDTDTLGGFSDFESIAFDVGSENPRSITRIPGGIIVKTKKGFYAIDSALNPSYVGADVEAFNSLEVTSANLIPDLNEVRFTTATGEMLIYNYFYGRWSTATNLAGPAARVWKNKITVLRSDGTIFVQNPSVWKDAEAAYGMVLESGWISFGNLSSFKRVYQLMLMGSYKSNHKLRVKIAYDNNDAWEHGGVYDPTASFPVETYGDDSPYGETDTPYGGEPVDYCIRVNMKRQKCSSFKFRIEELVTAATTGTQQSLTISDMGLLVGMKRGMVKKGQGRNLKLS